VVIWAEFTGFQPENGSLANREANSMYRSFHPAEDAMNVMQTLQSIPAHAPPSATTPRRRVVLTEADASRRSAMKLVLGDAGYIVTECTDAACVMKHAKSGNPDLIVLDASLPHDQARQCIRILKRCYQTSTIAILLTCPQTFDPPTLADLTHEGATMILHRPYTRVKLLEAAAFSAKRSETMAADLAASLGQKSPCARRVKSNNALLARPIACPFHDDRPQFDRYLLRPGSATVGTTFLDMPIYESAEKGFDSVNYQLLSIMVCPECLFASSHPGYFIDPAEHKERHFAFNEDTRSAMAADAEGRRQFARARGLTANFFNEHRTPADAMLAYDLAMRCSEIIYARNKYTLPGELLRLGNYHLRVAQIFESRGPLCSAGIRKHLLAAIAPLRRAEAILDGAARYKAVYQLMAIGITLGEDHAANEYLNHLADLEAAALKDDRLHARPYLQRARQAWEERESNRLANRMVEAA
jgi:CheY-like chemotaxis protein